MNYDAVAAELNDAIPFNHTVGLKVVDVGDGFAAVTLPDKPKLQNHLGTQHAGGLFAAGEAASGAAFIGAFGDRLGTITPLAQSARIEYRKLATGTITARARLSAPTPALLETLDEQGAIRFPVEVNLADEGNEVVATMTVDWYVQRKDAPEEAP
jgi:acyl-coenzyme A thioesterase PaaI-like protein